MSEQQSPAQQQPTENVPDLNNELKARREKLALLRESGNAFPNDFRRDSISDELHAKYGEKTNEELEAVWSDKKPAKAALDTAVSRGNAVLNAKPALKKAQPF